MTYTDAYKYIESLAGLGSRPGTDSIKELLLRLDNPQNKVKVVHIAGTNGKGSVFAFLDEIMRTAGYKTGRYISPTICTYLERFQINHEYMTENEFADIMAELIPVCNAMVEEGFDRPTAFETETVAAFLYALKGKVDILLLETGMGGKGDATNVVEAPVCTVISSISMDHMQFLGNSLSDILEEKMGIMRKNIPVVAYELPKNLEEQWLARCRELTAPHVMTKNSLAHIIERNGDFTRYIYKDEEYTISMTGVYQVYNSILAADTARVIDSFDDSFNISEEHIKEGLKNARWRGRFEKIQSNPPVYVDGAHNEGGWLSLAENIKAYFKDKHIIYICGVLADKEYHKMIKILSPYSNEMIVLTPDNSRGLSSSSLQNAASKYFTNIYQAEDVLSAKKMAEKMASGYDDPVILIFGSLSFIGQLYD